MSLPREVRALMGNHESMLLRAIKDREVEREWIRCGGNKALNSFGASSARAIPKKYTDWLHALPLYVEDPDYLFVHSSIQRHQQMALQPEQVLLWDHQVNPTLQLHLSKILVCGHSPDIEPVITPRYINLDTGIASNGYLTCMNLISSKLLQADAHGKLRQPSLRKAA
jgi:serine/threonine protein phosphatase 1